MNPSLKKDYGQQELFRSRLDQIINMNHPLAQLSKLDASNNPHLMDILVKSKFVWNLKA